MRVLVTRPEPGGERTAGHLAALGHQPVRLPLFRADVTATPSDLPPAREISGLIATSARAFDMFLSVSADGALRTLPVHVVGPATARAARDAGFTDVREAGGAARDLAKQVTSFASRPLNDVHSNNHTPAGGQQLVYLAGTPRTAAIEDVLDEAGLAYSVAESYEMTELSYSTDILISVVLNPPPAVVLFYSANAARRFATLVQPVDRSNALESTRFLCLSAAIATELPEPWRVRCVVAEHPDENSLLASLAALG